MIQIMDSEKYFKIIEKFKHIPFSQSKGWYNYLSSKKNEISFFVDNEKDTKIACWGREQKIPFVGLKILRIDGECYLPGLSEKVFTKFYSSLLGTRYAGIEINSSNPYNINFEIGIRRAGFLKPISFSSSPLSIEIDLNLPFQFDRNWKRNVKKAIKNNISFSEIKAEDINTMHSIVEMFKEMAELKKLKYRLDVESLSSLTSSEDMRTFLAKNEEGLLIAARIVHEHNKYISEVYTANSLEARNCGAIYYLIDRILNQLKDEGNEFYDFGRIPPSNHVTDSVYLFKNSSRGKKIQYNGEWVYYKKKWFEYLVHFFKHFIQKSQRY